MNHHRFCPIWWLIVLHLDKSVLASTYFVSKAHSPQACIISNSLKEPGNFKVYYVILKPLILFWQRSEPKKSTTGVQLVEMSLEAHIAQPVDFVHESWKCKQIKPNVEFYCNHILLHLYHRLALNPKQVLQPVLLAQQWQFSVVSMEAKGTSWSLPHVCPHCSCGQTKDLPVIWAWDVTQLNSSEHRVVCSSSQRSSTGTRQLVFFIPECEGNLPGEPQCYSEMVSLRAFQEPDAFM